MPAVPLSSMVQTTETEGALMLFRLYHQLIVGHTWRTDSIAFNAPQKLSGCWPGSEGYRMDVSGFTEVNRSCCCGAHKRTRMIGDHREQSKSDELQELRKMAGLK